VPQHFNHHQGNALIGKLKPHYQNNASTHQPQYQSNNGSTHPPHYQNNASTHQQHNQNNALMQARRRVLQSILDTL